MRSHVSASVLLLSFCASLQASDLTVVLQFDSDRSPESVFEMKQEVEAIFRPSGYSFDWKTRDEFTSNSTASELVVIRFKGKCGMRFSPSLIDERGPLAETFTSDGVVLPFSQVQCDRVSRSVRSALPAPDGSSTDRLLGRALGRVVAHEIYHILGHTGRHAKTGVAKRALTGEQLISGKLNFTASDIERFHNP